MTLSILSASLNDGNYMISLFLSATKVPTRLQSPISSGILALKSEVGTRSMFRDIFLKREICHCLNTRGPVAPV